METKLSRQDVMAAHYSNWKKSGLSKKAYCDHHGLGYHTFLYWVSRISPAAESPGSFSRLELLAAPHSSAAQIEIAYGNGTSIRLQGDFSPAFIKALL
jgi:hypothetical protein